ncbi:hypothetical protein TKK_0016087 [Trichogramma kaykai]
MGSRSPSEYLEFLIAKGPKSFGREAILRIWRETIPSNICIFLDKDITSSNEESMIKKPDEIYVSFGRDGNSNISYGLSAIDNRGGRDEDSRISILEKKLDLMWDSIER